MISPAIDAGHFAATLMTAPGDEPTTPAIAWNGRNGALNGPNADDAAVGHQGTAAFGGSGPTIFPPGTRRFA
jgi:hypothetical protein